MIWTILYVLGGLISFVAVYRSSEFTKMRDDEDSTVMLGGMVLWVFAGTLIVWPFGVAGWGLGRFLKRGRK